MPTRHLSLRIEADTLARLEAQSRKTGRSRSHVAKTLLEEGLRIEAHPGIVFRPGPAGRRPGLAGGPDVWEVARLFQETESIHEEVIQQIAILAGLSPEQVQTVLRYYVDFREEIDDWIQRVDDEAEQAEAAWRRQQALFER
ncbi:MAG: CopG family transcriptional regulator [Dehalococcoidia bacterium]